MKIKRILIQFRWRFLLVRFLVNAIAVAITAAVTPKIYFVDKSVVSWLLITAVLGILNALLKPILQFLTLQFIFVTYGLVIVLVNTLILLLLSFLFPARFAVDNLLWALVGGLVLGLLSSFLESLLGLTMPIVPEEEATLRRQLEEEARPVDWRAVARREAAQEEQALAIEATAAGPAAAGPAGAEPSTPGPDEGPAPPAEVAAPSFDSVIMPPGEAAAPADAGASAEAGVSAEPEPAPEPLEELEEEDRP